MLEIDSIIEEHDCTKAGGVKNRPTAQMLGTPKSLRLENHTKSQRNAQNSLKVLCVIEKKQI